MTNSMPCSKKTPTLLTLQARCSTSTKPSVDDLAETHQQISFVSQRWAHPPRLYCRGPENLRCCLPQCHAWYQLVNFDFFLFVFIFIYLSLALFLIRSIEHNHIKDNFISKVLRIQKFGNMKLEKLEKLLILVYVQFKENYPIWWIKQQEATHEAFRSACEIWEVMIKP